MDRIAVNVTTLPSYAQPSYKSAALGEKKTTQLCLPKIIELLGYDPLKKEAATFGERMVNYRRARGITQEELAKILGLDPSTLARWERGEARPTKNNVERLRTLIGTALEGWARSNSAISGEELGSTTIFGSLYQKTGLSEQRQTDKRPGTIRRLSRGCSRQ